MKTLFDVRPLMVDERTVQLEKENAELRIEVERLKAERDRLIGLVSADHAGGYNYDHKPKQENAQ